MKYYSEKISLCERDSKNLFKVAKHLLEGPNEGVLPVDKTSTDLAQDFSDFFIKNIETIRNKITSKSWSNMNKVMIGSDADSPMTVSRISFCNDERDQESDESDRKFTKKTFELDPIPICLLKKCLNELLPILTKIQ